MRSKGKELLSDREIASWLKRGGLKPLHDGGGLYLRLQGGHAYWYLRTTGAETGARTWAALFQPGSSFAYPSATLAEARGAADEARRTLHSTGRDPVRQRRHEDDERRRQDEESHRLAVEQQRQAAEAERQAALERERRITLKQLYERWASVELTPRLRADGTRAGRKDGGAYTLAQFKRRVYPKLGEVPVADIKKADLLAILDAVKAEGKLRTANVLLADLKQMLRFALTREIVERNVLDVVTKKDAGGKETERERVLDAEEIAALAKALPAARMHPRSVIALWIILTTGCRIGELMSAQWQHVDLEGRNWHLPDTKNQREHDIHLSTFAVLKFRHLLAMRESDKDGKPLPWLFANTTNTGPVDVKSFGKQLADRQRGPEQRLAGRSKNTVSLTLARGHWTAHDLRRSAASLMAELGISGDVIDECLNHKIESRVRRTYIRNRRIEEQARAFDALGARLEEILRGKSEDNVVPIRSSTAA